MILALLFTVWCAARGQQNRSRITERRENYIDIREQLKLYTMMLDRYKTPVMWQTVVATRECDLLMTLPDGNLLYGFLDMRSKTSSKVSLTTTHLTIFPFYGPLCKVDAKTGNVLWQYERSGFFIEETYSIVDVTEKMLFIQHQSEKSNRIICVNLDTGREIWREDLELGARCILMYDMETLFVYAPADKGLTFEGFILEGRQKRYSITVYAVGDNCAAYSIGDNRMIVAKGDNLLMIDFVTGAVKHRGKTSSPPANCYAFDAAFLLIGEDGTATMTGNDGSEMWRISPGYAPYLCTEADGTLYWMKQADDANTLVAVDMASGSVVWEKPLDGYLNSNFCIADGKLALTTPEKLCFFDATTGAVEKEIEFNKDGKSQVDRITLEGGNWVVTTEESIACYSPSFDCLWRYDLKGFVTPLSEYDLPDDEEFEEINKAYQSISNYKPMQFQEIQTARQSFDKWQRDYDMNKGRMSSQERELELNRGMAQAELAKGEAQLNATLAAANLQLTMMETGAQIMLGKALDLFQAMRLRSLSVYELAVRETGKSRQGKYYIRRFETGRSVNLLVVDTESGKWAELVLGPRENAAVEREALLKSCVYLYHPDEETISTFGVGLDPSKWETIELARTTTVKCSLLSFRIADMNFREYGEYAGNSMMR